MNLENLLSERVKFLPEGQMHKFLRIAAQEKNITSFGPGEPDFTTPQKILDYGKTAFDKGLTHYSPSSGRTELKKAIGKKLEKENKIKLNDFEKQLIVTNGSTEAILLTFLVLLDPGEEVIVPNPGFLAFRPCVELVHGVARDLNLKAENGFEINPDELAKLVSNKTRAIIINTPGNPTGNVLNHKTLEEIADIAIENDLIILSDEAYELFTYGKAKHLSIGSLNGLEENVITLQSFSKTFAMTGFRVGYAAGPEPVIREMTRTHMFSSICAPTISQVMAIKAFQAKKEAIEMRDAFEKRRNLMIKLVKECDCFDLRVEPEGAFYLFPKINLNYSSLEFTELLLNEAKVLVIPGTEFGSQGEGFVRLSYATTEQKIRKGIKNIKQATKFEKTTDDYGIKRI
ncbi:MAG: pyridoxal phosphate-dependent aminotransferase [archaeon]